MDLQVALLSVWWVLQIDVLVKIYTHPLVFEALRFFDDDVRQCFTECTSVDMPLQQPILASDSDSSTNRHLTNKLMHLLRLSLWGQLCSHQNFKLLFQYLAKN